MAAVHDRRDHRRVQAAEGDGPRAPCLAPDQHERGGNREGRQTLEREPRRDRHRERDADRDCDQTRTTADSAPTVNTSAAPTMAGHARPRSFGAAWFTGGVRILLSALECQKGAAAANLASHRRVLVDARDAGCALAVFPEMSLTGSVDPSRHEHWLVGLRDPVVADAARLTAELGVAASFGISERADPGGAYITQVFAADGRVRGVQRKRHLGEDEVGYCSSDEDAVFALDGAQFTIAICAEGGIDRPFEHARSEGVDLVCFSAAPGLWGRRTTEEEWRAGWDWWCDEGLGDLRRHARECGLWIADRDAGRLDLRRGLSGAGGAGRPER